MQAPLLNKLQRDIAILKQMVIALEQDITAMHVATTQLFGGNGAGGVGGSATGGMSAVSPEQIPNLLLPVTVPVKERGKRLRGIKKMMGALLKEHPEGLSYETAQREFAKKYSIELTMEQVDSTIKYMRSLNEVTKGIDGLYRVA